MATSKVAQQWFHAVNQQQHKYKHVVQASKMDVSPYLSAIQLLSGQNASDKYKELHSIASQICNDDQERSEFLKTGATSYVQTALFPHLRILVGNKLQHNEAVIEALKSDDVTIIKQALDAKWFFSGSNNLVNVEYFVENIMPVVSLRTRLEIVKTLASCLMNESKKAEHFFSCFADLYGVEQTLSLLVACSESYIFGEVLKRRIVIPSRILNILYRKYPQLVIRYLQLGNEKNKDNKEDRIAHKILLISYSNFLPILVKQHTREFIELYECLPSHCQNLKLGNTRATFFLKTATDVLIKKPQTFLKLLPLKLVSIKLSTDQFETMFENLFPKHADDVNELNLLNYLKYYPKEKRMILIRNKYQLHYKKELLDKRNLSFSIFNEMLPDNLKEEIAKKTLAPLVGKPEYQDNLYLLPPKESIPLLKQKIRKPSDKSRSYWINQMISSCSIYNDKEHLLEVLYYYNAHHKNERVDVLSDVFDTLVANFDVKSFDNDIWQVLKDMLQRAYIKGELFTMSNNTYVSIFKAAVLYFMKQCKADTASDEDKVFADKLIGMIVEGYLEYKMRWNFIQECPELGKDYLQKYLTIIPEKYCEEHRVWNKFSNKLNVTLELLRAMYKYDDEKLHDIFKKKMHKSHKDNKENEIEQREFGIKNYSWLINFAWELLKVDPSNENWDIKKRLQEFRELLHKHDPEWYQGFIDEDPDLINNVETSDALSILKHDRDKVLIKWTRYLNACRTKLQTGSKSARRFVLATKWYQEIPLKFVEQCLLEIEEKGSTLILAILLEGEAFEKVIKPYLPKDKKLDINDGDAKKMYEITSSLPKAINLTNPPVSFDIIASFCQGDYVSLATQMLTNVAQRVPINRVLNFADQLVDKPISVKKLGIRLVFQVATKAEIRNFLKRMWSTESNSSIREVAAKMIFNVFKQWPSTESWELIELCINGLTGDDKTVIEILKDIEVIDKNFVSLYIQEVLKKLDAFSANDLDEETKCQWICGLVEKIDESIIQLLPEELVTNILNRYFFKYPMTFVLTLYLFSNSTKFDLRFKTFMRILEVEMKKFNEPHPNLSRYYPANKKMRNFIPQMVQHLVREKHKSSLLLIEETLKLFSTILKPWQDPRTFIALSICREFFKPTVSELPREFGMRCGKQFAQIVKDISSEIVVRDIARELHWTEFYPYIEMHDFKLSLIEGLMEGDDYYGSLVGISLVNSYELTYFDERYDKLMRSWQENPNTAVQAVLSVYLNEIEEWNVS